jgi:hypothetical protein
VEYFDGFFAKLGQFAGFSLHIIYFVGRISESAMKEGWGTLYFINLEPRGRVHPHTVNFRRLEQRSCDGRGRGGGVKFRRFQALYLLGCRVAHLGRGIAQCSVAQKGAA